MSQTQDSEMNRSQEVAFEIITNAGSAKSLYIEIVNQCQNKNFDKIDEMMKEAETCLVEAHHAHFDLVQQEIHGNPVEFSLILVHAEDQLMNAETMKFMAEKFVQLYRDVLK